MRHRAVTKKVTCCERLELSVMNDRNMNNNNNLLLSGDTVMFPDGDTLMSYADPDVIGTFGTSSYARHTS